MTFHASRYPKNWKAIAEGIRLRSNNACEVCRAPNATVIERGEDYYDEGLLIWLERQGY